MAAFNRNENEPGIADSYKYLGFYLHENLNFDYGASKLADVGSRALQTLINKLKTLTIVTFNTKLYNTNACSNFDYASEIWGLLKQKHVLKFRIEPKVFSRGT